METWRLPQLNPSPLVVAAVIGIAGGGESDAMSQKTFDLSQFTVLILKFVLFMYFG